MSEVEEVHPERVKWIELGPVPINAEGPVAWDGTKGSYASHRVRLRVRFLGIREQWRPSLRIYCNSAPPALGAMGTISGRSSFRCLSVT